MKSLKDVLHFAIQLAQAVDAAKRDDGKFTVKDLMFLLVPLSALPDAVVGFKDAAKQWESATDEQKAELIVWINESFSLKHKKTDKHVKAALAILVNANVFLQE